MEKKNSLTKEHNDSSKNLKDYLILMRHNLFPIILISSFCIIIASVYAITAKNIYKSVTTLKISKPSGSILNSPFMGDFGDFATDRFIANEIEILKSYHLREKVAQALVDTYLVSKNDNNFYIIFNKDSYLTKEPTKLKTIFSIAELLTKNVIIDQKRGLDIADITAESPSPYEAALIANCYAAEYKKLNLEINRDQLRTVKDYLSEQKIEKQQELIRAEDILRQYQEKGGIIALDEQAKSLITQLSDFDAKKNSSLIDLNASNIVLSQLKTELKNQDPKLVDYLSSLANEGYIKTLQEQIGRLETTKDMALANEDKKNDNTVFVKEYDNKINELKRKLNEKISEYKSAIFASSPTEVKELTQKIIEEQVKNSSYNITLKGLEKIVSKYEAKFNSLPKTATELGRLQRKREALEKLYLLVEEKYQEASINEQSQPGNVLIVDAARIPLLPSKPNRLLLVLLGIILGIGMSFGYIFVKNYFNNTIKNPEDLQKRNINVLAWIPEIEDLKMSTNKENEFIVAKRPESIPSEAFRALRTRVQFTRVDTDSSKTILITSSTPQEGKTTICINLAGSFAQTNRRTLILDCDLRKPRVHSVFRNNKFPGIVDYLFNNASLDEITRSTEVSNLFYISAGTIPPNPAEILESAAMKDFLEVLKKLYDVILVDSPPVIAVTDSEILSRMVDATLLVVSADSTEIEVLEKAVELLKGKNSTFIGAVLNNFLYKNGYAAYYKYYYYYSQNKLSNENKKLKTIK